MAVEDVGRIINPLTLHGQTVGAIVQGLGGALLENLVYDAEGQFLSGTLADYLLPTASDFPVIRAHALEEKPAPHNPLGAKGAGEGGIIPVGGVIANAVANALGVEPNVLPLSPPKVWELIQAARADVRHGRACPGHPCLAWKAPGVDAQHKAGHDVDGLSCHSATMNDATTRRPADRAPKSSSSAPARSFRRCASAPSRPPPSAVCRRKPSTISAASD